jgi:hypothetical protein
MAIIGTRKMLIYGVLGAGSLGLAILGQPTDDPSVASARPATQVTRARTSAAPGSTLSADAAVFLTRLAHRTAESKASTELFASHSWYVPPPPPPPAPPAPPAPPPAPTAPPLPFTFLGSYAALGDQPTYFLSRGDRIYDVKVGESIDIEYSLAAADGSNLIFTYKPLNARQSLPAGAAP